MHNCSLLNWSLLFIGLLVSNSVCHWDQLKPKYDVPPASFTVHILVSVALITTCIICCVWNIFHLAEFKGNTDYTQVHITQGIILPPRSCTLSNNTLHFLKLPHSSVPLSWFFLQYMFFLLIVLSSTSQLLLLLVTVGILVLIPQYLPTLFINTLGLIYFFGMKYCTTHWIKILILTSDSMCGLPILSFHNGSGRSGSGGKPSTSSSVVSGSQKSCSKRKAIKRTIDRDHSDNLEDEPPKKRGRPSVNHPYQPCGPCSIWLQTGRDARLMQYHKSRAMTHPGKLAESMSAYVSQSGVRISLQPDSCVCNACDMDYLRNKNSGEPPRRVKLRDDICNQKHCILCCTMSTNCPCTRVQEWGPSTWYGDKSVEWWGEYFVHKGMHTSINPTAKDMCRVHLREYRRCLANRSCIKCSVTSADKWFPAGGTDEFEWVCNVCEACSLGRERLESMLKDDLEGENETNKYRAELVELALNEVRSNMFIYTLPLKDKYLRNASETIMNKNPPISNHLMCAWTNI